MATIRAIDYTDLSGVIVRNGELIAAKIIELLRSGQTVLVDLQSFPGVSSSYFNVFLLLVRDQLGIEFLDRVEISDDPPLLKQVFDRSREAIKKAPMPQAG